MINIFTLKLFCHLLFPSINIILYKSIPPCDDRLYIYEGFISDIPEELYHNWIYSFFIHEGILNIEISSEPIEGYLKD